MNGASPKYEAICPLTQPLPLPTPNETAKCPETAPLDVYCLCADLGLELLGGHGLREHAEGALGGGLLALLARCGAAVGEGNDLVCS